MIHYLTKAQHEPKINRAAPHGVRLGVCMEDVQAVYKPTQGPAWYYLACSHHWVTVDDSGRYSLCIWCGLEWDKIKDPQVPEIKEQCNTCLSSFHRSRNRDRVAPPMTAIGTLQVCRRCGVCMCEQHAPADSSILLCRSCLIFDTKQRNKAYADRKAEQEAGAAILRANLDTDRPPNVTVLAEAVVAKASRRRKAVAAQ